MYKIVLVRHGESAWNLENRFTGWTDVGLSDRGIDEAKAGGKLLKKEGYTFDEAHTSVLKRAIKTLWLVLEELDLMFLPVHHSWRLNERHYGSLQGLNKPETVEKHGEAQVKIWRRSYDTPPPPLDERERMKYAADPRYAMMEETLIPANEALKNTVERFLPYWYDVLVPSIKSGKKVLIAAHGNSLRALVKYLDNIPESEIVELNIPTGIPLVYELDKHLKPIKHYYLGDPEEVKRRIEGVANQLKKK